MRKFTAIMLTVGMIAALFPVVQKSAETVSSQPPFATHEVRVLVVSPSNLYFKGGHYLISDLAGYGFNVTQHTSDSSAVDYRSAPETADLSQYDAVILHGSYFGQSPTKVTLEEIRHFTSYNGILISIGNALFVNETSGTWWDDFFYSFPLSMVEERFGIIITRYLKDNGASYFHNNGTFTLFDNSIPELPTSLDYVRGTYGASQFQMALETTEANLIYSFQTQNGITTAGVTFYRNATGAVGIFIQGSYIYAEQPGTNQISYLGMIENSKRPALIASLIAYALGKDTSTIVKPQPLANIILNGVGQTYDQVYLDASLSWFNYAVDKYNATPTIGFIDYLDFKPDYWQAMSPNVLTQLKTVYRDWEYSTALGYYTDLRLMTQEQVENLIDNIKGNFSRLGMDLFSTVTAPYKGWNQSTLDAMSNRNLYLLDALDPYYYDWWNLRVNSSVIVHSRVPMLPETVIINGSRVPAEDFLQPGLDKDAINSKYFSRRDTLALALLNGFPSFVYYVPNFRWDKVGTYSLEVIFGNLTSEIPDIRFVPLIEAGLYFGNKWMRVQNAIRDGSTIEFDVDASSVPNVVSIGKGMLWLRINANESIQEVYVNNDPWFYFDEHSVRMPTPDSSVHVRVVLGSSSSPRVHASKYKVTRASYDGNRFNVSIASSASLNVSVSLFLPKVGPFSKDDWTVFCLETTEWNYGFNSLNRLFEFWAISDGIVDFEVGMFWIVEHTIPRYDSEVTVSANFSGLELEVNQVTFSYDLGSGWTNVSAASQGELWIAVIPAMPYGNVVNYRLFAYASIGKWFTTEIFSYEVVDYDPPELGDLEWGPYYPAAGQAVTVRVSASEPRNASGVKDIQLRYYLGTGVTDVLKGQTILMTNQNGAWVAEIPGQSGGGFVAFSVTARDVAGNEAETDAISYSVWLLPIPIWLFVLIVGVAIAACIAASLYFFKLRKPKLKTKASESQK